MSPSTEKLSAAISVRAGVVDAFGEHLERALRLERERAALRVRAPSPAHGMVPLILERDELPSEQLDSLGGGHGFVASGTRILAIPSPPPSRRGRFPKPGGARRPHLLPRATPLLG